MARQGPRWKLEVKASASVMRKDFVGLEALAESAGERWLRGVVLYTGDEVVGFDERLVAMPVSALWQ